MAVNIYLKNLTQMLLAYHDSLAIADVNTLFYGVLYSPPAKVINHRSHILAVFGLYSVYCCRCGTHLLDVDVDGCGEEALGVEVVGTTLHHGLQVGAHHAVEDFRAIEHHLDGLCEVILLLVEVEAHLAFGDGFVYISSSGILLFS